MWLTKKGCSEMILKEWDEMGRLKGQVSAKLRKLLGTLKRWNEKEGSELEENIKEIEGRMKELDECCDQRELTKMEEEEVRRLNVDLWEAIKLRESIWRQKLRIIRLREGI